MDLDDLFGRGRRAHGHGGHGHGQRRDDHPDAHPAEGWRDGDDHPHRDHLDAGTEHPGWSHEEEQRAGGHHRARWRGDAVPDVLRVVMANRWLLVLAGAAVLGAGALAAAVLLPLAGGVIEQVQETGLEGIARRLWSGAGGRP
jgi:hypothetical protein